MPAQCPIVAMIYTLLKALSLTRAVKTVLEHFWLNLLLIYSCITSSAVVVLWNFWNLCRHLSTVIIGFQYVLQSMTVENSGGIMKRHQAVCQSYEVVLFFRFSRHFGNVKSLSWLVPVTTLPTQREGQLAFLPFWCPKLAKSKKKTGHLLDLTHRIRKSN